LIHNKIAEKHGSDSEQPQGHGGGKPLPACHHPGLAGAVKHDGARRLNGTDARPRSQQRPDRKDQDQDQEKAAAHAAGIILPLPVE
jgi:hypothetical protein